MEPTNKLESGQAMLLSVVILGGALLSAASVAGLLLIYQIRNANDAVSSAKALFAADTGIEQLSLCYFKGCLPYSTDPGNLPPVVIFSDGSVTYNVISASTPTTINITSKGYAANRKVIRILETIFENL